LQLGGSSGGSQLFGFLLLTSCLVFQLALATGQTFFKSRHSTKPSTLYATNRKKLLGQCNGLCNFAKNVFSMTRLLLFSAPEQKFLTGRLHYFLLLVGQKKLNE
jgi:hypothetical protein